MEKPIIVRVIHAYKPVNNDELKLDRDDIITVTQKEEGGWWEGTLNGRTGWFPSTYVTEDVPPIPQSGALESGSPMQKKSFSKKGGQHGGGMSPLPSEDQLKYRRIVLGDLIESEESFLKNMEQLWEKYVQQLAKAEIFSSGETTILMKNIPELIQSHTALLQTLRAEQNKNLKEQRVGKSFLDHAPKLESAQRAYCLCHPKVTQLIEKYREAVNSFMESTGASPGVLTLVTALSLPFRRFEKYQTLLQQIELQMEESHKDRGDLQRSIEYYKEIDKSCGMLRKQVEMELEVLNGSIAGWEGSDVSQLGEIVHMNLVHLGEDLQPRYFVLFANTLLILSYNSEQNSFSYEGKIPVSGVTLPPLSEKNKHLSTAFEIAGPMIEPILVNCASRVAKETWLNQFSKTLKASRYPSHASAVSQSYGQLSPPTQAWSISRLRPTPPTNPLLCDIHVSSNGSKLTPTKGNHDRVDSTGAKGNAVYQTQLTNGEDLAILSIVDAFCSSNRQTSGGTPGTGRKGKSKQPGTLAELVLSLRDEVTFLKTSVAQLTLDLEEEQKARKAFQEYIKPSF